MKRYILTKTEKLRTLYRIILIVKECDTSGNVTVQEYDTEGTQLNENNCGIIQGYYLNGEEVTGCETVEGRETPTCTNATNKRIDLLTMVFITAS